MGKRICAIFSFSLVFFLATPSSMQASASSGTVSPHSITQRQRPQAQADTWQLVQEMQPYEISRHVVRELRRDMANPKLNMKDWTVAHNGMSLAQAFGLDKGTVSFPKLGAKLPVAASASKEWQNLPVGDTQPPSSRSEHDNYELAKKMAAAQPYGWTGSQFDALNNIVTAESGWNPEAENPSSGAYGIPQALPGSKMASAGKDWKTDPGTQIAWMLEYIRSRYGTPQAAWQFHLANGWY